ncbi:MAG: prepilin peptidase, partial [Patescibacteria group bacterium]
MTSSNLLLGFVFIFGCLIGSYLAVVIDRYGTKRSANSGRSSCNHCHRTLTIRDLMPLFSYILLRGRCRSCHKPISWQNFVIELLAGVGAALIFWQVGFGWVTVGLVIAFWIGLVIFWIDLRDYIIPDGAVLAL